MSDMVHGPVFSASGEGGGGQEFCLYWYVQYNMSLLIFQSFMQLFSGLINTDEPNRLEMYLGVTEALIRKNPDGLTEVSFSK